MESDHKDFTDASSVGCVCLTARGGAGFQRTTFLAHSAGSHVAVSYLEGFCEQETSIKSLILMSPVDGYDPFGIVDEFCIVPGQRVNFTLPALVLTAGLDADKGQRWQRNQQGWQRGSALVAEPAGVAEGGSGGSGTSEGGRERGQ